MSVNTNMKLEFAEANNVSRTSFSFVYPVVGKMELSLPVTSLNDAELDVANLENPRILFLSSTLPVTVTLTHESTATTVLNGDFIVYGFDTSDEADKVVSLSITRPVFVPPDPQTDPPTEETPAVVDVKVLGI